MIPRAAVACTTDSDGDGYSPTPNPTCPAALDCNDVPGPGYLRNPAAFEVLSDGIDQDCDGRDAMRRYLSATELQGPAWTTTGSVSTDGDGNTRVGGPASPASSTKRTFNVPRGTGGTGVMVDVAAASGAMCTLTLSYTPNGGGPLSLLENIPAAAATTWLEFGNLEVPHTLGSLEFACPPNSSVSIDWFQVQNADEVFPPPAELSIAWHDTRAPAGGFTSPIVRGDGAQFLYMASDVAGVARYDTWGTDAWEEVFGTGENTLALGGTMSVADVLPRPVGNEVYALAGDALTRGSGTAHGGLWYSADRGGNWSQLADSFNDAGVTDPADDDVAGFSLFSQCPSGSSGLHVWKYGGGKLLAADWLATRDVVYIANADPDARGVSVYDEATGDVCPLLHTGDALPAQYLAGILRVDAEPFGTPVLLVGYRGRSDEGEGMYACTLPASGMDCSGATSAYCEAIPESLAVDVRDLELDEYSAAQGASMVFVADAGNRPVDTGADGLGDDTCTIAEPGIDLLELTDDASGVVTVASYARVADETGLPAIANLELTGLSTDPGATYVFANVPASRGALYDSDRLYRVERASLALAVSWTPLNSETDDLGDGLADSEHDEDVREAIRHANLDIDATWLGESIIGQPAVFPARFAPGTGYDTTWLPWTEVNGEALAATSGGFNGWLIDGLDSPWYDDHVPPDGVDDSEEETTWVFWPDTDPTERHTYQTMVAKEAATTPDGQVFTANGDVGILYLDATVAQSAFALNGAEIDCLWHDGFRAGSNSVSVGMDGSVWMTLADQSSTGDSAATGYPHDGGVVRYAEGAFGPWSWTFAAGAFTTNSADPDAVIFDMDVAQASPDTYNRLCGDLGTSHFVRPMDLDDPSPFSGGDPLATAGALGNPFQVRALDATTAAVLFKPTSVTGSGGTFTTGGGLYVTVRSGVGSLPGSGDAWLAVPFDGAYTVTDSLGGETTGTCDESTAYTSGSFQLVHPGVDSYTHDADGDGVADDLDFDGYPDDFLLDLVYVVAGSNGAPTVSSNGEVYYPCNLARVLVADDGTGALASTWEWIPLRRHFEPYAADTCGVSGRNIQGATVAPWADEVYLYGSYWRDGLSGLGEARRGGGACAMALDTHAQALLVDPSSFEYGIGTVAPHPQVSDLLAILPTLDVTNWLQCNAHRDAYATLCSYPWPVLAERVGAGWALTELSTQPPTPRVNDARWSDLGIPVGGEDEETWLLVATGGSGTWRGVVAW